MPTTRKHTRAPTRHALRRATRQHAVTCPADRPLTNQHHRATPPLRHQHHANDHDSFSLCSSSACTLPHIRSTCTLLLRDAAAGSEDARRRDKMEAPPESAARSGQARRSPLHTPFLQPGNIAKSEGQVCMHQHQQQRTRRTKNACVLRFGLWLAARACVRNMYLVWLVSPVLITIGMTACKLCFAMTRMYSLEAVIQTQG
ncbi:hypothetical protein SVAN01_09636 [Stagonosporopsis vannaccii]|nr:hypothetical protein SVAN01_09636 [Stagonosporopsis vannaccii]